jgi:hypothetical protein
MKKRKWIYMYAFSLTWLQWIFSNIHMHITYMQSVHRQINKRKTKKTKKKQRKTEEKEKKKMEPKESNFVLIAPVNKPLYHFCYLSYCWFTCQLKFNPLSPNKTTNSSPLCLCSLHMYAETKVLLGTNQFGCRMHIYQLS